MILIGVFSKIDIRFFVIFIVKNITCVIAKKSQLHFQLYVSIQWGNAEAASLFMASFLSQNK